MRKLALAFCLSSLMTAALIGCTDDSASSAAVIATESSQADSNSSSSTKSSPSSSATEGKSSVSSTSSSSQQTETPPRSSAEEISSSSSAEDSPQSSSEAATIGSSDDGKCTSCDSFTAADPELTEKGGKGSVTTYGSVTAKETSLGGACNYGQTNIQYYAAIHVNVSPGDELGPWNGGSACGGCVHVKARTPDGWKEVTVRITDRCPDANCGVDLGGAPASDIMGINVGRYSGEWDFVSCEGVDGVWGDSTSIWVKEGASEFWSIIHVRNPTSC